jgi:hypothetical protein
MGFESCTLMASTVFAVPQDQVKKSPKSATTYPLVKSILVYTLAGGIPLFILSTIWFLTAQTSRQISDYWIRGWTSDR